MEENIGKTEGQSAAAETALEEPKMGNLFEMSMPHFDVSPPELEKIPLNDQLNQLVVAFLKDRIRSFEEEITVNPRYFPVDTTDRTGRLGPPPNVQKVAEIEAQDRAFNEIEAAKWQERHAWAKKRLKECQNALAAIQARPHRF